MEARAHAVHDFEIVGYAESLTEDLLPRAVVPVFRLRQEPERFLVPPFRLEGDTVVGAGTATAAEIATAVTERRFSRLERPIAAKPDHQLWIDSSYKPRYEPTGTARQHLMAIAKQSVAASKEALRESRYDAALRLSQRAISADEGRLDAVLTQAIVHRLRGDEARVELLGEIAAAIDPRIDFRSWVDRSVSRHMVDIIGNWEAQATTAVAISAAGHPQGESRNSCTQHPLSTEVLLARGLKSNNKIRTKRDTSDAQRSLTQRLEQESRGLIRL